MRHLIPALFCLILSVFPALASAEPPLPGTQVPQHYQSAEHPEQQLDYLLYLPDGYGQSARKWPLVIFLHGSGERGDNLMLVEKHGPPRLAEKVRFPFILVSPQCPRDRRWKEEPTISALQGLLRELKRTCSIDEERIYLTGLSMGGQGTWYWALRDPNRFAAILPICGKCEPEWGVKVAHLPTWVFHGAKDPGVALSYSEEIVAEMKQAGGDPKLTVYPDAEHDAWTETYNNPEVYNWLLSKTRKDHIESAKSIEPLKAPKPE